MTERPKLMVVESETVERTRVCNIAFRHDPEHEWRCIQAIRNRSHPQWSRSFSDFRVVDRPMLRKVR
jgi:hypothetical protein